MEPMIEHFNLPQEVATLTVSLFVAGGVLFAHIFHVPGV